MYCQQTHTKRNTNKSYLDRMFPGGRIVIQKATETTRNGKCEGKSK